MATPRLSNSLPNSSYVFRWWWNNAKFVDLLDPYYEGWWRWLVHNHFRTRFYARFRYIILICVWGRWCVAKVIVGSRSGECIFERKKVWFKMVGKIRGFLWHTKFVKVGQSETKSHNSKQQHRSYTIIYRTNMGDNPLCSVVNKYLTPNVWKTTNQPQKVTRIGLGCVSVEKVLFIANRTKVTFVRGLRRVA